MRGITGRSLRLALALAVAGAMGSGCETLGDILEDVETPTASIEGGRLSGLTAESASLVFDVRVKNPYGAGLPLTDLDYSLATKASPFATGKAATSGSVPAYGSKVVQLPVTVRFKELLAAASGVKLGQVVPYTANLGLSVDAPGTGALRLPLSHSGEVPVPNVPKVELVDVAWGDVSLENAEATLKLRVTNTNEFAVDLRKLDYALKLDGRDVFGGNVASARSLKPGESGEIQIPVKASVASVGRALVEMLGKGRAAYSLSGGTSLDTRFGPIDMPFEQSGSTRLTR